MNPFQSAEAYPASQNTRTFVGKTVEDYDPDKGVPKGGNVDALIPGTGHVVGIANAVMMFREEHNCLHDDIAGTRVVKLPY